MKEIWKPIKNYENIYQISNYGRIRSLDRYITYPDGHKQFCQEQLMYPGKTHSGYLQIGLNKNHRTYRYYVHQLVAQAFLDNPYHYTEIHHKDYDKTNNNVNNLMWITHEENILDLYFRKGYKDSSNKFKTHRCADCGKLIYYTSKYCKYCAPKHFKYYKFHKLNKQEIINILIKYNGNFTQAAKEFNMTNSGLRKWCKKYKLSPYSKDWKNK